MLSRRAFVASAASALALGSTGLSAASARPLRVGLIGCDSDGISLARAALDAAPSLRLVALGDEAPARATRALAIFTDARRKAGSHPQVDVAGARRFGGPDAAATVIGLADVDIVLIAGIPAERPCDALLALAAGKHVYLAGPGAVDAAGCATLLSAARLAAARALVIGVDAGGRQADADRAALARVRAGADGAIISAEAMLSRAPWRRYRAGADRRVNWYYDELLSGGLMLGETLPAIDRIRRLSGAVPIAATGTVSRDGRNPGDLAARYAVRYEMADGGVFTVDSTLEPGAATARRLRLIGASGAVDLDPAAGSAGEPRPSALRAFVASVTAPAVASAWRDGFDDWLVSARMAILGREAALQGGRLNWGALA